MTKIGETIHRVGGIVLCGGKSSRMGQPKMWLPFGDELLLQRVVRIVKSVVSPVVVVAASEDQLPPLPDSVQIERDRRENIGPLEGLAVGLAALEGRADAAFVTSCDVPLLKPEFVRKVVASLGDADAAVPRENGRYHPLAAAYRLTIRQRVDEAIAADRRAMFQLVESIRSNVLDAEDLRIVDPKRHSLRNVNTPEEYEAALAALK